MFHAPFFFFSMYLFFSQQHSSSLFCLHVCFLQHLRLLSSSHLLSPLNLGKNLGERMDLESLSFCLSHNYKRLFSLSVSLSLPLHGELPASSGGALLSLGAAPVTTVLKCRGEGLYGVGRPQQATGHVCKRFNLHVHTHKHTHVLASYSLLDWGGVSLEVSWRSLKPCACVCVCVRD